MTGTGKGLGVLLLVMGVVGCTDPVSDAVPGVNLPGAPRADGYDTEPIECPSGTGQVATWTIMHYAAGDNDLEPSILHDINEMELGHNGSDDVNIIVQLDRREPDGVWRYEIQSDTLDNDPDQTKIVSNVVGYSEREPDSGDYNTLLEFGRWAATCYPADNYFLILGGHGRGWSSYLNEEVGFDSGREDRARSHGDILRFIAPDDTNGSEMYVDDLALTIASIAEVTERPDDPEGLNRLVAYGSDACLMSTIETAQDLSIGVRYIMGSEQTEPEEGWAYADVVRALTEDPQRFAETPQDLLAAFVDAYAESYAGSDTDKARITLSVVDTAGLEGAKVELSWITYVLTELLDDPTQASTVLEELIAARGASASFANTYTDLGQLLTNLRARLINRGLMPETGDEGDDLYVELRDSIDTLLTELWPGLVLTMRNGEDYADVMGLSIFFPPENCSGYLSFEDYANSDFARETGWADVVAAALFTNIREAEGDGLVDLTIDGRTFDSLEADCIIGQNDLYVNVQRAECTVDGETIRCPTISLGLRPTDAGLTLFNASVNAREFNGLRASARNIERDIESTGVERGISYDGYAVIPFETDEGTVDVTVAFICEDFELSCR